MTQKKTNEERLDNLEYYIKNSLPIQLKRIEQDVGKLEKEINHQAPTGQTIGETVLRHERLLSKHLDENGDAGGPYQSLGAVVKKHTEEIEELKNRKLG